MHNVQLTDDELGILKILTGFSVYVMRELEKTDQEPIEHPPLMALNRKLIDEYISDYVGPNASKLLQSIDEKFFGYLNQIIVLAASDKLAQILGSSASDFTKKLKEILANPGAYKVSVVDIGELKGMMGNKMGIVDEPSINLPDLGERPDKPEKDERKFTLD